MIVSPLQLKNNADPIFRDRVTFVEHSNKFTGSPPNPGLPRLRDRAIRVDGDYFDSRMKRFQLSAKLLPTAVATITSTKGRSARLSSEPKQRKTGATPLRAAMTTESLGDISSPEFEKASPQGHDSMSVRKASLSIMAQTPRITLRRILPKSWSKVVMIWLARTISQLTNQGT